MPVGVYLRTAFHKKQLSLATSGKAKPWLKGRKLSLSHRRSLSKARIGRKLSASCRRKMSRNNAKYWLGKKFPPYAKIKMSSSAKGNTNWLGKKHKSSSKKKMVVSALKRIDRGDFSSFNYFKGTSIEKKISKELTRLQLRHQSNSNVTDSDGTFIANVDNVLLDYKIVIECDGCWFHRCYCRGFPSSCLIRIRDRNRALRLKRAGWQVFRFWEHEINKSPEKCINKVAKYISGL